MRPAPLPPATREIIARLHEIYCQKTGTEVRLRPHYETLWDRLLTDYESDGPKLSADLQLVIRYLVKQIGIDKRHPGALKLKNLLQPDQFEADVNEARIVMPQKRTFATENTKSTEVEDTPEELAERARIVAEEKAKYPHLFKK